MNKGELVAALAAETGFTKKDSEAFLKSFTDVVVETLSRGDKIQLVGFGTFEVKERKARQGRNPRNPEETIEIPASKAPVFKAGKSLKESVNQ